MIFISRKGAKFQILNLSIPYLSSATPYFYKTSPKNIVVYAECGLYLIYAVCMCNHTTISVIALQAVDEIQQ
ncbi:MAG: hypothetical protein RLZZ184_2773 [Cyanobacteriota bacterium]|jgi:hypothetical protein